MLADNFHLYDNGPLRNLQVFSNSGLKFQHVPSEGCQQNFTTNAIGDEIYVNKSQNGVMLSVKNDNATYYLRVNQENDYSVELVCQEYVNQVSNNINGSAVSALVSLSRNDATCILYHVTVALLDS